jgi:peptide/nickel transport system substrate-binding protein
MRSLRRRARSAAALLAAAVVLASVGTAGAAAGAGHVAGQAAPPGQYGHLPAGSGTPLAGGTVTVAETAAADWILPLTPAAYDSVYTAYQFQDYQWRPLWWAPQGVTPTVDPSQSLAKAPAFGAGDRTVTIDLNPGWRWSDGQPVTSADVAFDLWLTKAAVKLNPANDGAYVPGLFPDFVTSIATPSPGTVVLTFDKTYNPNFLWLNELLQLTPLPAHAWSKTSTSGKIVPFGSLAAAEAIYRFLAAQSADLTTYATNPLWQVVDGPFRMKAFDPSTGGFTLDANTAYSGPAKPHLAALAGVPFATPAAELQALEKGTLDVGAIDDSDLADVPAIEKAGYDVWGYPDFGFSFAVYNFKDPADDFDMLIAQPYIRQALAQLENQPAEIASAAAFDHAGGADYGPAPAIPQSPFDSANSLTNPYPYSISAASTLLSSHGWAVVPGGVTTCAHPGTAAGECGAGIPAGTPLSWNLVWATDVPGVGAVVKAWAANSKQVGVTITLEAQTFNYIIINLDDVTDPGNAHLWAIEDFGGFTDSLYPTTDQLFNTKGAFNFGGFSSKSVDEAITKSTTSLEPDAVTAELQQVTADQPGLFQPNGDLVYAFKKTLEGPAASFEDSSEYEFSPESWFFVKS